MKFIYPSVEYLPQPSGLEGIWHQIATATRVCYQSQARENESDEDFVKRVILKPALVEGDLSDLKSCKFNNIKGHFGCLEHGTVYLALMDNYYSTSIAALKNNKWSQCVCSHYIFNITTNVRCLIENNLLNLLEVATLPNKYHKKRYTFKVTTDIGVSREGNRSRANSTCEESTRYNAYDKGKYGSELTYAKPAWYDETTSLFEGSYADKHDGFKTLYLDLIDDIYHGDYKDWGEEHYYAFGLLAAEFAYMGMRDKKAKAEKARQVLNLNTKTQVVWTAFADDWKHFISLRADNASGKSHPNINLVAKEIKRIAEEQKLW